MDQFNSHRSTLEHWHHLVSEVQFTSGIQLSEALESYLVFLLIRFTEKPELASAVLAEEYLQSLQALGCEQRETLRDVGDKCLIFAGFFPERALRKQVSDEYFTEMGRLAYGMLANIPEAQRFGPYVDLHEKFISLKDLLASMHQQEDGAKLTGQLDMSLLDFSFQSYH